MTRDAHPRHLSLPEQGLAATALAISLTMIPAEAQAQARQQIEISGYVAPRCWAVRSPLQPAANGPLLPRVICNQSNPRLRSRLRMLDADGALVTRIPTQIAGRAALEIVVSPQI